MADTENKQPRRRRASRADTGSDASVTVIQRNQRKRNDRAGVSEQTEDAFSMAEGLVETCVRPPYDVENLCGIFDRSNVLRQCVDAMVVNTSAYGYRIVATDPDIDIDPNERAMLSSFINYANPDEALETVRSNTVEDMERIGFGFMECFRNNSGGLSHVRYLKSRFVRATPKGKPVTVIREMLRGNTRVDVTTRTAFRRYVMSVNGKKTYFKEFGDPRRMSYKTGKFDGEGGKRVRASEAATELLHFRQKSDDIYGIPKWVHQMPSILGSREAEECNFQYFEDNMIPSAILTVAGGKLTSQSFRELNEVLTSEELGKSRQNKIILLEAVPEKDGLEDGGSVTIKLDKLTDSRPSDWFDTGHYFCHS
ncbi:MAG: hypothetical protein LPH21_18395 [Shewanella sp.]|nr:hypothetical protein [Shewanella sp.]